MTVYTRVTAAAVLQVALRTVDRLIAEKRLAYSKEGRIIRIQEKDIVAYLDSTRVPTDAELEARASSRTYRTARR